MNHPFEHFRDVWYSHFFDRTIHAQWLEQGTKRFEERLREQTQLAMDHQPEPLPPEILQELEQMQQHWQ